MTTELQTCGYLRFLSQNLALSLSQYSKSNKQHIPQNQDILAEDIAARVQISLKSKKIQKGAEAPPMVLALYFLLYVSTFYVLSVRVLGF